MTQPLQPSEVTVSRHDMTLLDQFENTTLSNEAFGHREHVQVAWTYLQLYDLAEATRRFIAALKGFANFHGATGLYHETITWAFLLVINERIGRMAGPHDWREFAEENADLLDSGGAFLDRYYQPGTLKSDLARKVFLLPDRCPGGSGWAAGASGAGGAR